METFGIKRPAQSCLGYSRMQSSRFRREDFVYRDVRYRLQGYEPQALVYMI